MEIRIRGSAGGLLRGSAADLKIICGEGEELFQCYKRQNFRCGGCHEAILPFQGTGVDHDHRIGIGTSGKHKIRGIACNGCNSSRFPLWDRGPEVIAKATRLSQFYDDDDDDDDDDDNDDEDDDNDDDEDNDDDDDDNDDITIGGCLANLPLPREHN